MKFYTQYDPKPRKNEVFGLPSETIPDQSLTIQEIIARFVRTGSMPCAVHSDIGDNEAFEPEFDPLDVQPAETVSALYPSKEEPAADPVPAPDPAPAPVQAPAPA